MQGLSQRGFQPRLSRIHTIPIGQTECPQKVVIGARAAFKQFDCAEARRVVVERRLRFGDGGNRIEEDIRAKAAQTRV